jgi:hypothetical protein
MSNSHNGPGGAGGNYGGGGGGSSNTSDGAASATAGAGAQGVIVITYTPLNTTPHSLMMTGAGLAANDNVRRPVNDNESPPLCAVRAAFRTSAALQARSLAR